MKTASPDFGTIVRIPTAQEAAGATIAIGARGWIPPIGISGAPDTITRHGCGNGAPMEITERFPQALGNLAQSARFPHSHKPPLFHDVLKAGEKELRAKQRN
jgi:hypothetical protein